MPYLLNLCELCEAEPCSWGPAQPSVQAGLPSAWAGAGGHAWSSEPPVLALVGKQGLEATHPLTSQISIQPFGHSNTQGWKVPHPLLPAACCETQAKTSLHGYMRGPERGPGHIFIPSRVLSAPPNTQPSHWETIDSASRLTYHHHLPGDPCHQQSVLYQVARGSIPSLPTPAPHGAKCLSVPC